jgi:hypothetical protein
MRILFYIFLFIFFFAHHSALASEKEIQIERAKVAVGLFKKVCFINYNNKDERISFLDSKFQRHDEEKKELFLGLFQAKEGDVWAAIFPKGLFAVVVEKNGNCHVVAQKADEEAIHSEIEALFEEAQKNLRMNVKYNTLEKSTLKSSGFDVIGPSGKNLIVVVASTKDNPTIDKPAALITMAVAAESQ